MLGDSALVGSELSTLINQPGYSVLREAKAMCRSLAVLMSPSASIGPGELDFGVDGI